MDYNKYRQAAFDDKFLELILFITEQCNFRCIYCYEDFAIGRMKPEVIEGIKNLLSRRAKGLDILKISWFGGEPLIVKHLIYDLSKYCKDICAQYNIDYYGAMTTNGYLLTPEVMENLYKFGIKSYQISLDGVLADHDTTRVRIDGSGTFQKIWQNLLDLKKLQQSFEIILRVHVHVDNISKIKELLFDIENNFGNDGRFKIYIKGIFGWRDAPDNVRRLVAKKEFYKEIEILRQTISHLQLPDKQRSMCYAAMANSLTIRADGKLGKCTVALNDATNHIGKINKDGTLEINNSKLNKWFHGLINNNEAAIRCPLHTMGSL